MKPILPMLLILVSAFVYGQEKDSLTMKPPRLATKHEVGFSGGYATGVGVSYRYYPKKVGIQVTTAPIISKDNVWLSLGTSLMYTIDENRVTKFYLYYGNHILYQNDTYTYENYNYESETYDVQTEHYESFMYMTGLGCGIELTAWQRVGFNFNFGLGAGFEPALNDSETNYWMISPIGGLSIFYKF